MLFSNIEERIQRRILRRAQRRSKRKLYRLLYFDRLDNVEARNHLLAGASCYYEFPFLSYNDPPSNSYIDQSLIHGFQKAGFEPSIHSGPRQTYQHSDSQGEIPFEGVIRGREFGNGRNILLLLSLMVLFSFFFWAGIIGGIITTILEEETLLIIFFSVAGFFLLAFLTVAILFLIWRKKAPFTATVVYWGVNQYRLKNLSEILGFDPTFSGKIFLDEAKDIVIQTSLFHPTTTILHVCIAFEMKPKRFGTEESVQSKFEGLKTKIYEELGMTPIQHGFLNPSKEISAKPIFKWKKRKLKGLEKRFPLN